MHAERPSQTASLVATLRALGADGYTSVPGYVDPISKDLLSGFWAWVYRCGRLQLAISPGPLRALLQAQVDLVPIRVTAIDQALIQAGVGVAQVVILGAGLDTRAYRLDALARATVYEVDHPNTQRYKAAQTEGLPVRARRLVRVPVDFERDRLDAQLAQAGHDPHQPTVWVWEGVSMYLEDPALMATLQQVHARSAPGSTLILHYHEPGAATSNRLWARTLLWIWGEHQVGERSRAAVAALLERAGFDVGEDTDTAEQARRLGATPPQTELARVSRVVLATIRR